MVCTINTFYMAVDIREEFNLRKLSGEQDKAKQISHVHIDLVYVKHLLIEKKSVRKYAVNNSNYY